jgi:hypothetical protein
LQQHAFQGCPLHSTSLPKVGWVPPLAVVAKWLGSSGRTQSQRMLLTQNAFMCTRARVGRRYERPLGQPKGPAELMADGATLRREFASGTVATLDTSTELFTGQIDWSDKPGRQVGRSIGSQPASQALPDAELDRSKRPDASFENPKRPHRDAAAIHVIAHRHRCRCKTGPRSASSQVKRPRPPCMGRTSPDR